jgi:superfamily II DNA or RNA helicase
MIDAGNSATGAVCRSVRVGDRVRIRRRAWTVADVRAFAACELVTAARLDSHGHEVRRFLVPFDIVRPLGCRTGVTWVRRRHWLTACRSLLARAVPSECLRAAHDARIDLLPYQLEPALAIVAGLSTRTLLADEVGLGKTIQASLIVAELRARGAADRVLVLTPAGLREQWAEELRERFGVEAFIADSSTVRRRTAEVPVGLNPWSTLAVAIASLDYIKRPEVLPAIAGCRWDAVIVDEAHAVATSSERHEAASLLCGHAAYVVLLSATPHNGDRRAFASLCSLGTRGRDAVTLWRRRRADVAHGVARRIHRIAVRLTPEERRLHRELARLRQSMRAGGYEERALAVSVLCKRAYSSASSLARSVDRRLAALWGHDVPSHQLGLPLAGERDRDAEDEPPEWTVALADDARSEQELLMPLADAALAAARHESKVAALTRLVRRLGRMREPAIVFTEFRDTLTHVAHVIGRRCAIVHGGMSPAERRVALADFTSGRHNLLLATDAAAEGLNLQAGCRVVINLELPWNPMRLEQRIGRVDRIGQQRTVQVFHLIGRHSGEAAVLARLRDRLAHARTDIDTADPLGPDRGADSPRPDSIEAAAAFCDSILRPDLKRLALDECVRIAIGRLAARGRLSGRTWASGSIVAFARRASTRALLASGVLVVLEAAAVDADGRHIASRLQALLVRFTRPLIRREALEMVPALARWLEDEHVSRDDEEWLSSCVGAHQSFWSARLAREQAMAQNATGRGAFQPGLFDRRAERTELADRIRTERRSDATADIIRAVERASVIDLRSARVALVLVP